MDVIERLHKKIEVSSGGCWEWKACLTKAGYGQIRIDGKTLYTHRVTYQHYKGILVPRLELDHLCRNRKCCNPEHLEQVTRKINQHRGFSPAGIQARQTHCKRGHPFIPENMINRSNGRRICKICANTLRRLNRMKIVL